MRAVISIATRGDDLYVDNVRFVIEQVRRYGCQVVYGQCSWSAPVAQTMCVHQCYPLDFDWCLFVDADVAPPLDALEKLAAVNHDIVAAPVWHYAGDVHLNLHYNNLSVREHERKRSGVEEIISTSLACTIVHRNVFDKFRALGEEFFIPSPLVAGDNIGPYGGISDHIFWRKARNLGYKMWMCWDVYGCVHYRPIRLDDETIRQIQTVRT